MQSDACQSSVDAHADPQEQKERHGASHDKKNKDPGHDASHGCHSLWPRSILIMAAVVGFAVGSGPLAARERLTPERLRPAPDDPNAFLVDGHYLRGTARLARLRAQGLLPDIITDGRCRFGLAGDPGVAYYVRTCR